ncbi:MAG: hypothetical protein AAF467_20705 [Actinomycetota bacterium]
MAGTLTWSPNGATPSRRLAAIADIGTLNEGSLHAALKRAVHQPGDEVEVALDGFVIDIRRGDLLIEIQTGSFAAMGRKLDCLLGEYRILIVHPVAVTTYLHREGAKPRRSPKRRSLYHLFDELVSIPTLLDHPHLAIEAVLVDVDAHQQPDASMRRRRGGWRTVDRRLREVHTQHHFASTADLLSLVPDGLPGEFTTADLAALAGISRDQAQKMAYCLREASRFEVVSRDSAGYRYRISRS